MLACYLLQQFFTALRSSFLGIQTFLIFSHCSKRVCYTSRDQPRKKKQLAQSKRGIQKMCFGRIATLLMFSSFSLLALLFHDKYDNFHLKTTTCLCRKRKWSPRAYFYLPNSIQEKPVNQQFCLHLKSQCWKGLHLRGERSRIGLSGRKDGAPRTQGTGPPSPPPRTLASLVWA